MKIFLLLPLLMLSISGKSQVDENGNPVFNSIITGSFKSGELTIQSHYYTLKNNIENKHTSVFINSSPTIIQVEKAALELPADFFSVIKDGKLIRMILVQQHPVRQFLIIDPVSGKSKIEVFTVSGDISETRAKELLQGRYDENATMDSSSITFNGKRYEITSTEKLQDAVIALVKKLGLAKLRAKGPLIRDAAEINNIIIKESKKGGKLDFFTEIKGKEYDAVQIKPRVFTTRLSIALYKWGRANYELGVESVDAALENWAKVKGRAANEREYTYIKMGFNKELEE